MKKTFLFALVFSFFALSAPVKADQNALSLEAGYRVDNFNWTIAPPDGNPNILSELSWKDLEIFQIKGKWIGKNNKMYVRTAASYGRINDGQVRDSDYLGNDRTLEFSRSMSDSDKGTVLDATIGLGPRYIMKTRRGIIEAAPLIGASYNSQDLWMSNATQIVASCITPSLCTPDEGPFSGLDSSYKAKWLGPWVGIDVTGDFGGLRLWGTAEYHFLTTYEGEGNWNLRDDLQHPKSFSHESDATGYVFSVGADFIITKALALTASFGYQKWEAEEGEATFFISDGSSFTEKFNEADWDSTEAMLGLKYSF